MIEKLCHKRIAYLGCWLYLYLVIVEQLEHRLSGTLRTVSPAHIFAHVLASAGLALQVLEISDKLGHIYSERAFVCPQVLAILREFLLSRRTTVLETAWAVWNSQTRKYWAGFCKSAVLFVFFKDLLQIYLLHMLNCEKEFQVPFTLEMHCNCVLI